MKRIRITTSTTETKKATSIIIRRTYNTKIFKIKKTEATTKTQQEKA